MKTTLIVCADDPESLSHLFLDALVEKRVALPVVGCGFDQFEASVDDHLDSDHIVIFPCVISLTDARRTDLQGRIRALQIRYPGLGIHLANSLDGDPRLLEMIYDRVSTALKGTQKSPILTIEELGGRRTLSFDDFKTLPDQIPDVSAFIPGREGEAVWVRVILPDIPNARVTFYADEDRFSSSVALSLVRERGLFI
ncbi:MAG: hypothetical protein O3B73_00145, partial [bacterium]|nr:hypothetical protein [bacterium]